MGYYLFMSFNHAWRRAVPQFSNVEARRIELKASRILDHAENGLFATGVYDDIDLDGATVDAIAMLRSAQKRVTAGGRSAQGGRR